MSIKHQHWFSILAFAISLCTTSVFAQKWPGIRDSLYSNILKESRVIQVVLPKDYKSGSDQKYEVLYVLDGEWYMEQIPFIYNFTVMAKFAPENIFVLIPNTYVNGKNLRDRDFSPTRMNGDSTLGGADNFHAFLKSELMPYVEKKYPVNSQKSLVGSSFSGLFSVYAFVKDPKLFQSFIASDPNLNWDNGFVTKLAAEKLPSFTDVESTLFFAGLELTSRGMGSKQMDSVLTAKAPATLRWKFVDYKDETHYSVQHKAFYDGMRFSHLGYSTTPTEFHPMNGIVAPGKSLKFIVLNENPTARFTVDGRVPTRSSPPLRNEAMVISGMATINVKTFPNRKSDTREIHGTFTSDAIIEPLAKSKTPGLSYAFYDGDWDVIPDFKKLKPVESGVVAKGFTMNTFKPKNNAAYRITGNLEIPDDGYYIIATNAADGAIVYLGDKAIFATKSKNEGIKSFVVPFKKGFYPIRIEVLRKKDSPPFEFFINRTTPGQDSWWMNSFLTL